MEGFAKKIERYYPYLEDIRRRLYGLVIFFIIFFVLGLTNSGFILKHIISAFHLENAEIITSSPFQFLDLAMSVGLYSALLLTTPIFLYHVYAFLRDGLNQEEKRFFFLTLPASLFLFVSGFVYCFFVLYLTLDSIAAFNASLGIKNFWDVSKFLLQIVLTSALLGILFQYPLFLTLLIRVGALSVQFLRAKRRHAIALMFILTSLLPPTDGLSLIIMVVPLIFIYEMTILANRGVRKKESVRVPFKVHQYNSLT